MPEKLAGERHVTAAANDLPTIAIGSYIDPGSLAAVRMRRSGLINADLEAAERRGRTASILRWRALTDY